MSKGLIIACVTVALLGEADGASAQRHYGGYGYASSGSNAYTGYGYVYGYLPYTYGYAGYPYAPYGYAYPPYGYGYGHPAYVPPGFDDGHHCGAPLTGAVTG